MPHLSVRLIQKKGGVVSTVLLKKDFKLVSTEPGASLVKYDGAW